MRRMASVLFYNMSCTTARCDLVGLPRSLGNRFVGVFFVMRRPRARRRAPWCVARSRRAAATGCSSARPGCGGCGARRAPPGHASPFPRMTQRLGYGRYMRPIRPGPSSRGSVNHKPRQPVVVVAPVGRQINDRFDHARHHELRVHVVVAERADGSARVVGAHAARKEPGVRAQVVIEAEGVGQLVCEGGADRASLLDRSAAEIFASRGTRACGRSLGITDSALASLPRQ